MSLLIKGATEKSSVSLVSPPKVEYYLPPVDRQLANQGLSTTVKPAQAGKMKIPKDLTTAPTERRSDHQRTQSVPMVVGNRP